MAAITISREYGSNGAEIARLIASDLGFRLIDRNLVDAVAAQAHILPGVARDLDEQTYDWAGGLIHSILLAAQGHSMSQESYRCLANRLIREAAAREGLVVLGRGGRAVLGTAPTAFHVHVIAPLKDRVAEIARREHLGVEEARRRIWEVDHDRAAYVRTVAHVDWEDPSLYDLIVNTHRLPPPAAARLVIQAAREAGVIPAAGERVEAPHAYGETRPGRIALKGFERWADVAEAEHRVRLS